MTMQSCTCLRLDSENCDLSAKAERQDGRVPPCPSERAAPKGDAKYEIQLFDELEWLAMFLLRVFSESMLSFLPIPDEVS